MNQLLEVNNLKVSFHTYAGEVQAVRGVSFAVDRGETIAIVGESGSGKTVTSKAIMGLLPEASSEVKKDSEILFDGVDILRYNKHQWRRFRGKKAGMVFQDPMTSLNPTMKIGRQIAEGIRAHEKVSKRAALERTVELLRQVSIPNPEDRLEEYPYEFSGGMRQRVVIAEALAGNPELLIADEPTTALDVTIQAQILRLLKQIQKTYNTAIVLITHDLGVVAGMADKIAVMYAGKIVEFGTVYEIFQNPRHPYTYALLNSVPRLNTKSKTELMSIPGTPPDLIQPPKGCGFSLRCSHCMEVCRNLEPQYAQISETHRSLCWLEHPFAKEELHFDDVRSVLENG